MVDKPRSKALWVLNRLANGRFTLDAVIEQILEGEGDLSKRDKALFQNLVYGVLRWRNRIDWVISRFSHTAINRIDPEVLNLLRLGVFQMVYLNRVPDSAAVNTSVEMAKSSSGPWVVRFVNAVLRQVGRGYSDLSWPDTKKNPSKSLAVTKSFPEWLLKKWLKRFGLEETAALCDAVNEIPPITVRTNGLKTTRADLYDCLEKDTKTIEPTPYAPDGIRCFGPRVPISEMNTFKNGCFQVQDEAAQLVTIFLDPHPGEKILDACSGRGGKTGHMAQLMGDRGRIFALDNDREKLLSLEVEMKRLGISIVRTIRHDLHVPLKDGRLKGFDRILVDAPCSGLGVIRRNPDIKWSVSKENLKPMQARQLGFLHTLAPLLKPGGVLLYAVCSMEPEENEAVVESFLNKCANFAIDRDHGSLFRKRDSLIDHKGFLRTFPHRHGTDGFFSARLKRLT